MGAVPVQRGAQQTIGRSTGQAIGQPVRRRALQVQGTFDELGSPLSEATFVVVDLETTGGSAASSDITEVGAVKVRGGEVLGEFQSLVRPTAPVPPFIAVLTGITDAMVADAPRPDAVLPAFLQWAHGCVLVAHNAPFDVGFLRAGCERLGLEWPGFEVVDTARLARRVLTRDEAPDCKLSSLARLFRATTTPNHRALSDARATVDVLHGLLERLGPLGVQSVEELKTFSAQVTTAQRRKRHLAEPLPSAPGVYLFRDGRDRVLYVGTSGDIRARVRQYFTASENRTRMAEMVAIAERVDPVECATRLEAQVRELRLIAEHRPPYNRRSKRPEKQVWLKLTNEAYPRLSLVPRVLDDGADYLGPFGSRAAAETAAAAVHEAVPLRQCTQRLSPRNPPGSACALAQMGRCGAPCLPGGESPDDYAVHAHRVRTAFSTDADDLVAALTARTSRLSADRRYEDAAAQRDRLAAFLSAARRLQRTTALTSVRELVAAAPTPSGGWELHVVRHGRLAGAATVARGADPRPVVDALVATAETVLPGHGPLPASTAEEVRLVLRWLESPGVRLVRLDGEWSSPARGAGRHAGLLEAAESARSAVRPFEDRRGLRPVHQPVRHTLAG